MYLGDQKNWKEKKQNHKGLALQAIDKIIKGSYKYISNKFLNKKDNLH